jgi:hypothetical protein
LTAGSTSRAKKYHTRAKNLRSKQLVHSERSSRKYHVASEHHYTTRNINNPETAIPAMPEFTHYTTLFAPVLFFFSGVVIVVFLNKFIGKSSSNKKAK